MGKFVRITTAPSAAPTGLSAAAVNNLKIKLTWTDPCYNEDGFHVERYNDSTASWSQIATVGTNVTTYTNGGLTAGTSYNYRVRTYNAVGNSGYSNTSSATAK